MVTEAFIIQNPTGLHARPATAFVQKASSFPCEVNLIKGEKKVNGKSIMGVMSLAIAKGDELTLEVAGEREQEAIKELGSILEKVYE